MGALTSFLIIYLLGGLTFIPLLLVAVAIHVYLTFPVYDEANPSNEIVSILRPGDSPDAVKSGAKALEERFQPRANQEADVAAGYFAVCREYVPGGVNGKPPERMTPVGSTTISSPSPSVYQSMYRSIFDRKQTANPLDNKGAARPQKKGGNIFYVVLRHSHLLLFDDEDMLVVKFVLSLVHHDISIYGGGEQIPDGELFIKRNAICLTRKAAASDLTTDSAISKPFFLFADNTSDKEDFYFAMLRSQERSSDVVNNPPTTLQFEIKDIVALVQRLHSSEEHMQTRWFNAILGRIFLGLYKTLDVENFVRAKIAKKISRVKKPSFLSGIVVRNVDMGEGAPYITNPRLKDLTVDGGCMIEANISYTGNFRLEIAATAKIELGTRFNRAVNLLLAVVLHKVEGRILLRIKPPPSNRVWFTFQTAPKIEMSVQPIVSSRQITYTMILRQIENRIKEVIAESIVIPYWDDIAFLSTEGKRWRGGIWVDDMPPRSPENLETAAEDGEADEVEHQESENLSRSTVPMEKSMSVPVLVESSQPTTFSRRAAKSLFSLANPKATASSTSVETTKSDKPKAILHGTFTSASSPIVSTDITNVDAFKPTTPPERGHAASAMTAISGKSQSPSPAQTPHGSPSKPSGFGKARSHSSASSQSDKGIYEAQPIVETVNDDPQIPSEVYPLGSTSTNGELQRPNPKDISSHSRRQGSTSPSTKSDDALELGEKLASQKPFLNRSPRHNLASSSTKTNNPESFGVPVKRITLTTVANAAATAKRWGLNALQRNGNQNRDVSSDQNENDISQPMGRGRPLPPPGIPLPPPDRKRMTAPIPVPKRKLIPPPVLPQRPASTSSYESASVLNLQPPAVDVNTKDVRDPPTPDSPSPPARDASKKVKQAGPPILPQRRDNQSTATADDDGLFVVAAPPDSEPTTPLSESKVTYLPPWADDEEDDRVELEPPQSERP